MKEREKRNQLRLFELITTVFLVLMGTLFLLAFDTTGFERISSVKVTLFYIICGGYAGLMLLILPESILVGSLKTKEVWRLLRPETWTQRLALLYLGLTLVSALLSPHKTVWLGTSRHEGTLTVAIYVLCFYFVSKFFAADKKLIYIFGGSVSVFSIICILQLMGFNPFSMYPEGYNYHDAYTAYSGAYLGTIGNVDFVAAFLCIAIPLLAIAVLKLKDRARRWLLLPLGLSLTVLFWMGVLAGLVGVLCGAAVCLPVLLPVGKRGRVMLWLLLAAGTLGGVALLYFADLGGGLLHELHLLLRGQAADTFGSGRLYIWKNVWERLGEALWFGHGPDTMALAQIPPFERYDAQLELQIVAAIDAAHNEYLNILYHQGIFALTAFLGMLGCAFGRFVHNARTSSAVAMAGGAVLCYCIQAFFGISQPLTTPFFWIMLGVLTQKYNA